MSSRQESKVFDRRRASAPVMPVNLRISLEPEVESTSPTRSSPRMATDKTPTSDYTTLSRDGITPMNSTHRPSRGSLSLYENFVIVQVKPEDMITFTVKRAPVGLCVHLLDATSELAFELEEGDIVDSLNGSRYENPASFLAALEASQESTLVVRRNPIKSYSILEALNDSADDELASSASSAQFNKTLSASDQSLPSPSADSSSSGCCVTGSGPITFLPCSGKEGLDIRTLSRANSSISGSHSPVSFPILIPTSTTTGTSPVPSQQRTSSFDSDTTVCSDIFSPSDIQSPTVKQIHSPLKRVDSKDSNHSESKWTSLKSVVSVMKLMKRKKYPWVQLAGHSEGFKVDTTNSNWIMKRSNKYEKLAFMELMNDPLRPFVPEYAGVEIDNDVEYLQMSNLLAVFDRPNLMDCKMGCRTYLESEVDNITPRPDLLSKMIAIDPNEPTEAERLVGVTKLRYMKYRDDVTSIKNLKFRIDACKTRDDQTFSLKALNERSEIARLFDVFLQRGSDSDKLGPLRSILRRLRELRATLLQSPFFLSHEIVGSSLLFACDVNGKTGVWMIDFAKTIKRNVTLTHVDPWIPDTNCFEDEFLVALDNIIQIFDEKLPLG